MLSGLEFAREGLSVAYRASRAPQVLHVAVDTAGAASKRAAPMIIKRLLELINAGAAGGSMFQPGDGHGERLSGPWDGPDAFGPEYRWVLRVSGVAPLFLRTVVEQLRRCGWEHAVTRLSITGELPPAKDALSIDTKKMLKWLSDPDAYVDAWKPLAFKVKAKKAKLTQWTARLQAAPSIDTLEALKLLAVRWIVATAAYVDDSAKPVLRTREQLAEHLPTFHNDGRVFSASYEQFHHRAKAARAVLTNMLQRFAVEHAPIEAVELGFGT